VLVELPALEAPAGPRAQRESALAVALRFFQEVALTSLRHEE
jgi:hypothetical protein